MKAIIITIGDEILLGQILDTNSRYIARHLAQVGVEVVEMLSVADEQCEISRAVDFAWKLADFVFVTGGLGPTKDDKTKKVLADYFGMELVFNPQAYAWLEDVLAHNARVMNDANRSQALLPNGCTLLHNEKGTACGMWFERDGKVLVSMPGVPFETEHLMSAYVLPALKQICKFGGISYQMLTVYDIAEAALSERLADFEAGLPSGIALAYLPSEGYIRLRLTAKGAAQERLSEFFSKLEYALADLNFTQETDGLPEEELARTAVAAGARVAVAESCTGGNIARLITSLPGASAYFAGGVVAYANEVKKNVLGVAEADLNQFGAVSESVALQMAGGARRVLKADYAVAVTGIAGPDGGSEEKPVGTVWIAVAGPGGTQAEQFLFSKMRERNVGRASVKALRMLADLIRRDYQKK